MCVCVWTGGRAGGLGTVTLGVLAEARARLRPPRGQGHVGDLCNPAHCHVARQHRKTRWVRGWQRVWMYDLGRAWGKMKATRCVGGGVIDRCGQHGPETVNRGLVRGLDSELSDINSRLRI